jgi:predicted nucleic acid-binding protein
MKHFSTSMAEGVIAEFEAVVQESCQVWLPSAADYDLARSFVAQFASGLRGGDALHLAIARNQGADKVLTLDAALLKAAKLLKIPAARGIS